MPTPRQCLPASRLPVTNLLDERIGDHALIDGVQETRNADELWVGET